MDRHSDSDLLRNRDHMAEESFKVEPESFLSELCVCGKQLAHLALRVA